MPFTPRGLLLGLVALPFATAGIGTPACPGIFPSGDDHRADRGRPAVRRAYLP